MTNNNKPQIKKLEWKHKKIRGGTEWIADPIGGILKYIIVKLDEGDNYTGYINKGSIVGIASLRDAQSLLQADFEAKIEGCLS